MRSTGIMSQPWPLPRAKEITQGFCSSKRDLIRFTLSIPLVKLSTLILIEGYELLIFAETESKLLSCPRSKVSWKVSRLTPWIFKYRISHYSLLKHNQTHDVEELQFYSSLIILPFVNRVHRKQLQFKTSYASSAEFSNCFLVSARWDLVPKIDSMLCRFKTYFIFDVKIRLFVILNVCYIFLCPQTFIIAFHV